MLTSLCSSSRRRMLWISEQEPEQHDEKKRKLNHDPTIHQHASKMTKIPLIDSNTIVTDDRKSYVPFCKDEVHYSDDVATVFFNYPQFGIHEKFLLLSPRNIGDYSPVTDLKETILNINTHCVPDAYTERLSEGKDNALRLVIKGCNRKSLTILKQGIDKFNSIMLELQKSIKEGKETLKKSNHEFLFMTHILEQAYARSVSPISHMLSKSRGFSNTVYGEVTYKLVNEFIKMTNLKEGQTFLDIVSCSLPLHKEANRHSHP